MKSLNSYVSEMKAVAHNASKDKGIIGGSGMAWAMMIVGVVVTGSATYAATHKGMSNSALWEQWVDIAAFLPVVLLEGSALALVYGRHHWFRSSEQRGLASVASWAIWAVLGFTSIVHFALGNAENETAISLMTGWASYGLPLAIIAVPLLWKRLYDAAPESAMRVAILEAEAALRSQLVEVQREQNDLMISAYRDSLDTPRVSQARRALFEQASIEHAREIVGFIEGADKQQQPNEKPVTVWRGSQKMSEMGN